MSTMGYYNIDLWDTLNMGLLMNILRVEMIHVYNKKGVKKNV
jgi:hypothetical protein